MQVNNDTKTIAILDSLITQYRTKGLEGVLSDCNSFGNPELNFLYIEIYGCCKNGQFLMALAGAGMFLEQLTNELWISEQVHRAQLKTQFNTWDEVMAFLETQYKTVEDRKVEYKKDIRPTIEKILKPKDLEALELLREFIRNTFVHSKRIKLLDALQKNKVLPKEIPLGKATIVGYKFTNVEQVNLPLTHPLVVKLGFLTIAKQLAPAMLIFIFEMFKNYHKQMAPYKDDKIKFPGHECDYDSG